jgi:hypothetical protein
LVGFFGGGFICPADAAATAARGNNIATSDVATANARGDNIATADVAAPDIAAWGANDNYPGELYHFAAQL